MNDSDDYIIVRNPPSKSKALLAATQQPYYNDTVNLGLDYDSNLTDSMKRKRQIEYAEELRQQILQKKSFDDQFNNSQRRGFMSNLGSLYGDQSIEIERKRRQQEKLAESLRLQIEEKRRVREIEKQKEAAREASREALHYSASNTSNLSYNQAPIITPEQNITNSKNSNNNSKNRYLRPNKKLNFQTQPISFKSIKLNQPPKPLNDFDKNDNSNFSKTAPFAAIPHLTFEISSESPFLHSTVQTPPLGFSLRKNHQSSLSITAPIHQTDQPLITAKDNFSKSALSQYQVQSRQPVQPNRMLNNSSVNNSNVNNSVNKYDDRQINLTVQSDDIPVRLGTASELVYPDGHISPINSPH